MTPGGGDAGVVVSSDGAGSGAIRFRGGGGWDRAGGIGGAVHRDDAADLPAADGHLQGRFDARSVAVGDLEGRDRGIGGHRTVHVRHGGLRDVADVGQPVLIEQFGHDVGADAGQPVVAVAVGGGEVRREPLGRDAGGLGREVGRRRQLARIRLVLAQRVAVVVVVVVADLALLRGLAGPASARRFRRWSSAARQGRRSRPRRSAGPSGSAAGSGATGSAAAQVGSSPRISDRVVNHRRTGGQAEVVHGGCPFVVIEPETVARGECHG